MSEKSSRFLSFPSHHPTPLSSSLDIVAPRRRISPDISYLPTSSDLDDSLRVRALRRLSARRSARGRRRQVRRHSTLRRRCRLFIAGIRISLHLMRIHSNLGYIRDLRITETCIYDGISSLGPLVYFCSSIVVSNNGSLLFAMKAVGALKNPTIRVSS